ncbi:hypothetical protein ACFX19_011681 [Malus domestica]
MHLSVLVNSSLVYLVLLCLNWLLTQDCKKNAYMEAELHCSNAIQIMERKLRTACHASDANIDNVRKVLDGLLSDYEAASHGPAKWQKLTMFLQKSFEGPRLS